MVRLYLYILLFVAAACSARRQPVNGMPVTPPAAENIPAKDTVYPLTEIREVFTDSLEIGKKGQCKIELIKHRVLEDTYVIIKFYTRGGNNWWLQNTYQYPCNTAMEMQPDLSDFNNDGFNDITFISAQAARGGNEVRRLFVYDDKEQQLISIVNSEAYPNMVYNKALDCIDAFMLHGGSSTLFAHIKGDSLKTFAMVDNGSRRTVYKVDSLGALNLIREDSITDPEDIFIRYENYQPLKAYAE